MRPSQNARGAFLGSKNLVIRALPVSLAQVTGRPWPHDPLPHLRWCGGFFELFNPESGWSSTSHTTRANEFWCFLGIHGCSHRRALELHPHQVLHWLRGCHGATFVTNQFWCSLMFAPHVVGAANATATGWGNLGGGVTQIFMQFLSPRAGWMGVRAY